MDKFDEILASVAKPVNGSSWILAYDKLDQLEGPDIAVSFVTWKSEIHVYYALLKISPLTLVVDSDFVEKFQVPETLFYLSCIRPRLAFRSV